MDYQLTATGAVRRLSDGAFIPAQADNRDYRNFLRWVESGNTPQPYIAPPPSESDYAAAIQSHIDAAARSKQYANGFALASYVNSTIAAWAAEATAFVAWRDQVWVYAYTELAKVQSGTRPQPSIAGLIAELPAVAWPA